MNILKFRAWHKSTNTMVYFDPAASPNDEYQALHLWQLIGGIHEEGENLLMQSTGLTDKNGVEVLERDLIKLSTMFSIDKDDEYFHEGIYEVQMSPIYGVMLFFKKLTFEDGARNQYPIWGHIGIGDGLTKDREHQKSLAVSNRYIDYSDNFEVIGNIHANK